MAVKVAFADSKAEELESGGADLPDVSITPLKLPPLPREHIKSISGSLPGKLIGRIAALLALAAIALAWWALIDNWLPAPLAGLRDTAPWVFYGVVYGLPVVTIVFQLGRETWDRWHTKKIRERVISGEVIEPAYFRLTPYTARDHRRFWRADGTHLAVLSWIEDAKSPILYLTGASGTGKSSLLEAYCLPELRQRGWRAITVRSFADPAAELVGALKVPGSIWDKPPSEADAYTLLRRAGDRLAKGLNRLLIILDQFEEFLILHDEQTQQPFSTLLRRLIQQPIDNVRFLVVLRQEYEKLIDDLDLPRLRQGENWTAVGAFTARAAAAFLKASGLELNERLLGRMLKGAARIDETGGLFRPITLNMLGVVLTHHGAQLPANFDAERAIQGYSSAV